MKALREIMSYWNEGILLLSSCCATGWFGSRHLLGWLPLTAALIMFIAGATIAWLLANAQSDDEDDFSEKGGAIDKFIWLWVCFAMGQALFTTIGALT